MSERLLVAHSARLIEFLRRALPTWKRKTLEQRMREGCIRVNGVVTARNDPLAVGDEVEVLDHAAPESKRRGPAGIEILHDDLELVAIDKPVGLLSVSTDRESERTALALLRNFLSRPGREVRLWPVHRLDRETSGVLLFAKSSRVRDLVQDAWRSAEKHYQAVVEGRVEPPNGVIDRPLWEDAALNVRVGDHPTAKAARTRYSTIEARGRRTRLAVELDTGRRHQIRAHLAWLGFPVVGDPRYGGDAARMGLHAERLIVAHPSTGEPLTIEAPPPKAFLALLASRG